MRPLRDYFEHEAAPSSSERKTLHVTAANECLRRGAAADALRHLLTAGNHAACDPVDIERKIMDMAVVEKTWEIPAHHDKGPVTITCGCRR